MAFPCLSLSWIRWKTCEKRRNKRDIKFLTILEKWIAFHLFQFSKLVERGGLEREREKKNNEVDLLKNIEFHSENAYEN